jgi:hypothetical protein
VKFPNLFIFLLISNITYAGTSINDNEKTTNNIIKCVSQNQELNLPSKVRNQLKTFNLVLNNSLALQISDDRNTNTYHCAQETLKPLTQSIKNMNMEKEFITISRSINRIYPSINLSALAKKTFLCKSNKRLERLLGPGVTHSSTRTLVWRKANLQPLDGIYYETLPSTKTIQDRNIVLWAFIKELLHNKIDLKREFYARDGDLQKSVKLIKDHLVNLNKDTEGLISKTNALGFPYN